MNNTLYRSSSLKVNLPFRHRALILTLPKPCASNHVRLWHLLYWNDYGYQVRYLQLLQVPDLSECHMRAMPHTNGSNDGDYYSPCIPPLPTHEARRHHPSYNRIFCFWGFAILRLLRPHRLCLLPFLMHIPYQVRHEQQKYPLSHWLSMCLCSLSGCSPVNMREL